MPSKKKKSDVDEEDPSPELQKLRHEWKIMQDYVKEADLNRKAEVKQIKDEAEEMLAELKEEFDMYQKETSEMRKAIVDMENMNDENKREIVHMKVEGKKLREHTNEMRDQMSTLQENHRQLLKVEQQGNACIEQLSMQIQKLETKKAHLKSMHDQFKLEYEKVHSQIKERRAFGAGENLIKNMYGDKIVEVLELVTERCKLQQVIEDHKKGVYSTDEDEPGNGKSKRRNRKFAKIPKEKAKLDTEIVVEILDSVDELKKRHPRKAYEISGIRRGSQIVVVEGDDNSDESSTAISVSEFSDSDSSSGSSSSDDSDSGTDSSFSTTSGRDSCTENTSTGVSSEKESEKIVDQTPKSAPAPAPAPKVPPKRSKGFLDDSSSDDSSWDSDRDGPRPKF